MNLKKNDKIILIVGVIILIIAGVGIALYTTDQTSADEVDEIEDSYEYSYSWDIKNAETTLDSDVFVNEKSDFEESYNVKSPAGTILTNVYIMIYWEDDVTYGILTTKGQDTLSVIINYKGSTDEDESVGLGYLNFSEKINSIPRSDTVMAENYDEAENIVKGMTENMNSASFDVKVSINTGERIWRLLKYIRDKGNSFEIKVEYEYYEFSIEEMENENDDNDDMVDTGIGFGHNVGDFYVQLGYGRGMI